MQNPQAGEFLPLSAAAAIAYGSLVATNDAAGDEIRLDVHLNYLAAELASILAVYTVANGTPRILAPESVSRGHFKSRGESLVLPDRREPVSSLRVRRADLSVAIEQLRRRLTLPQR